MIRRGNIADRPNHSAIRTSPPAGNAHVHHELERAVRPEAYGDVMATPGSPEEHLDRLQSLEQELDDLYGHLGLPKPNFGELTVRRLKTTGSLRDPEHRVPTRPLRRGA